MNEAPVNEGSGSEWPSRERPSRERPGSVATGGRDDVLIVGAGPVGLATAIGCARRGLRVRVLERGRPPVDKACGEGIMPDGVARLRNLGVDPVVLGGRPFRGIRYLDADRSAAARFRGAAGFGVRRTRLQGALLSAARRAGVRVDFGVVARGLSATARLVTIDTDQGSVEASFLVGADGLSSRVRRWCGLDRGARGERFGVRRHYRLEPWTDLVEVHWAGGPGGAGHEAYVTPVGEREVGVAMLWRGPKGRFDDLLARLPALADRLSGAPVASSDLGAGPLERPVKGVVSGRVALVGDAAGYVDAITGEGLSAGFAQAEALSEALAGGALERYAFAHQRIQRRPVQMIRALLAIEKRPWLRRRFVATLARDPALFERLLEIHVGERSPLGLGWRGLLGVGRVLVERP